MMITSTKAQKTVHSNGQWHWESSFQTEKRKKEKREINPLIFANENKTNWNIDIHLDKNQIVFALASIGIMQIDTNSNDSEWKYFSNIQ